MIGGDDVIYKISDMARAVEIGLRLLLECWPNAVVECCAAEGDIRPISDWLDADGIALCLKDKGGFFAFRHAKYVEQWNERGAVDELLNTMIYFIPRPHELTVVVGDSREAEMSHYIDHLRDALGPDAARMTA